MLSLALEHLNRCSFIGLMERYEESMLVLKVKKRYRFPIKLWHSFSQQVKHKLYLCQSSTLLSECVLS